MQLVENLKSPIPKDKVRVKMFRHVMQFNPGDIVDCSQSDADTLCKTSSSTDGSSVKNIVKAMRLEDAKKLEAEIQNPKDRTKLTQKDMKDLGLKNVVETPKDESLDKILEARQKAADKAAKQKEKMKKIKDDADEDDKNADIKEG